MMICLQDEFRTHDYRDLLDESVASEYGIDLKSLYDEKPEELLNIFISSNGDELFFLLNGDWEKIDDLCDGWDNRIRVFTILNGNNSAFKKMNYNIVQLIVYSKGEPDRSREANLMITRKIIIHGDLANKDCIMISKDSAIELPFYMVQSDAFAPDATLIQRLHDLLPSDKNLLSILSVPMERVNRKTGADVQPKHYQRQDFEKIKEWLEK